MLRNPIFQLLAIVAATCVVLQLALRHLGLAATLVLVALAAVYGATIYAIRFHRDAVAARTRHPAARQYLRLVCWSAGLQVPVGRGGEDEKVAGVMLREPRDFDWAALKLRERVKGHDEAIDALIADLRRNVLLRERGGWRADLPPLGLYLFAGPEGIGKRHLAQMLGRVLYREGSQTVLRLKDYADDAGGIAALFGGPGVEGHLTGPLKAGPFHLVVLEDVEAAGPRLRERLRALLASGTCVDPASRSTVSASHCAFVLTTTRMPAGLHFDPRDEERPGERRRRLIESLVAESVLDAPLLSLAHEVLTFDPPDLLTKARVILMLMIEECRRYQLALDYVEPEVVVEEVVAFSEAHGFHLAESRVTARLRGPIARTVEHGAEALILTREVAKAPLIPAESSR